MNISPSIASANQLFLYEEVKKVESERYTDLHVDIEDGHFIPNITFGLRTIRALRNSTSIPFSYHLMVQNPMHFVDELANLHPSIIFVHVESVSYISQILSWGNQKGIKIGLAFNPKTPIDPYFYTLKRANAVLFMTSEPDGEGQLFNPHLIEKIKNVPLHYRPPEIWADGGIKSSHIETLRKAGVTNIVMGREIFQTG